MQIVAVENPVQISALETAWNEAYAQDEQAHLFCSWSWQQICRRMITTRRWFVLAGRQGDDAPFIGFLPLAIEVSGWHRIGTIRHLHLGGKPISDYTGMVCVPGAEGPFLTACAAFLQHELAWDCLHLHDLMDHRITDFVAGFGGDRTRQIAYRSVDCPYIRLDGDWEDYLKNALSWEPRRTLRKKLRRFGALDGLRYSDPSAADLDLHVETLLRLWQIRHGKSDASLIRNRDLLRAAFTQGHLWLRLAWLGDTPVCGLAAFVDPLKKAFYCFMTAYDPAFRKHSPGLVLYGLAIREAIARGYRHFDLLRGAADYKMTRLGAELRTAVSADLQNGAIWWSGLKSMYRRPRKARQAVGS